MTSYFFTGAATVTVETEVEAKSLAEAKKLVKRGECEWKCTEVDGDVINRAELVKRLRERARSFEMANAVFSLLDKDLGMKLSAGKDVVEELAIDIENGTLP